MALSRARKQELVEKYDTDFAKAQHAFLLTYDGVTVPQVTELRSRIRRKGGRYLVVKNTLARRAVKGGALESVTEHFTGGTAVAYSDQDPVALAKTLTEFAKEVPALRFKGAIIEGRPVVTAQIQEIALLPSREQLLTKLVFLLQSPLTRFVRVLAAVPQQFVAVLDQVRRKKEENA